MRDRPLLSGIIGNAIAALAGLAYARQFGRDPHSSIGVAMAIFSAYHVIQTIDGYLRR